MTDINTGLVLLSTVLVTLVALLMYKEANHRISPSKVVIKIDDRDRS